ncbi:MAG: hypothetical protein HRT94_02200 [Alphaproteobacteria bacterium]|nr:hypothetical protein [Alphaproteobacteria bacterium]
MCNSQRDQKFRVLGTPNRIWAVSAIHGDCTRLEGLHNAIYERITPGDRLVYLGNYTGYGDQSHEVIDELLAFRRAVLSLPGMKPKDITYLRGGQEEMMHILTQLQFCKEPVDTLLWMLGSGMSNTMKSYGICPHEGITAAREGIMSLTRWTNKIRAALRRQEGFEAFMTNHNRAAFTKIDNAESALFVNSGLDPSLPLEEQEDRLWWQGEEFHAMTGAYKPFEKVIRGFDPRHQGVQLNCVTASIDGGCGFGGPLVAAGLDAKGDVFELMEA